MKLILVESQKLHQNFFWSFLNKAVRFRKIAILQPSFSNKLFLKLNLSKNDFSKISDTADYRTKNAFRFISLISLLT